MEVKFSKEGETVLQSPKSFELQERARDPLSPCQVWWRSDFIRRRGGQKTSSFFVCQSVCLFVRHTFERQRLCARFRHEGVRVQKQF